MPKMLAPENGVNVRMYRQGHGDCFLLAFPRKSGGDPVYMMIDCGYKPGSQIELNGKKVDADRVVKDISKSTGNRLDVVVVTHEHQDHVNALGKFKDFDEIGEVWFAWTEDPDDILANELRERHGDQLLGLVEARHQLDGLAASGNESASHAVARLDELLRSEIGGEDETMTAGGMGFSAVADPSKSLNKKAIKVIKDKAKRGMRFFSPHKGIVSIPDVDGTRAFVLGPPRSKDLLKDEDPKADTAFPGHSLAERGTLSFFSAAKSTDTDDNVGSPFSLSYGISKDDALIDEEFGTFFGNFYGDEVLTQSAEHEVSDAASWRRIDDEWLYAAESFALKMNRGINNTSLVLAFELPLSKKVLLFAGDAQNGNWLSWNDGDWKDGDKTITPRDLLGRTVLYKVGHHGSHNATLNGTEKSDYPNLSWMATDHQYASEFTAMIPANRHWALNTASWDHPLPSIKEALLLKAQGRVFQVDTGVPDKPKAVAQATWDKFIDPARTTEKDLYIEYRIVDNLG